MSDEGRDAEPFDYEIRTIKWESPDDWPGKAEAQAEIAALVANSVPNLCGDCYCFDWYDEDEGWCGQTDKDMKSDNKQWCPWWERRQRWQ